MDYSSSQTHHQEQQQQQQQQQQQPQSQPQYPEYHHYQYQFAYDPSQQYQPYDPSSYYAYSQQHGYDPSYYPQNYAFYQYQQQPTSVHPPGVPVATDSASVAGSDQTHYQQNLYYAPNGSVAAAPGGMQVPNVIQVFRAAGNNAPKIGQPLQKSWKKGVKPFGGGARGRSGQGSRRPDSSGTPSHGRERGQGSKHLPAGGAGSAPGQASISEKAQVPAAPRPRSRMGWCELCKVDCGTPEILEQHKNGKKHKRNLQVHGEHQGPRPIRGQQNVQASSSDHNSGVLQSKLTEGQSKSQPLSESISPSQNVAKDYRNEIKLPKETVENSKVAAVESAQSKKVLKEQISEVQQRNPKRKMKGGGQGGKLMRSADGTRRPVAPPKPKQVIPLICELCNVKCDTQTVFQSHLAGKKHLAKVKRANGGVGLQSLYPPNVNAPSTSLQAQVQQEGINDPQVLLAQLLTYVLSQAQAPRTEPAARQVASAAPALPQGSGPETTQYQQTSGVDGSQANVEMGNQAGITSEVFHFAASGAPIPSIEIKPQAAAISENSDKVIKQAIPTESLSVKRVQTSETGIALSDQLAKPSSTNCLEKLEPEDEDPEEEPLSEDEEDPEEQEPENEEPNE